MAGWFNTNTDYYDDRNVDPGGYSTQPAERVLYIPPLTKEELQWLDILRESKSNPGLTDLCEGVKMYYLIGKESV